MITDVQGAAAGTPVVKHASMASMPSFAPTGCWADDSSAALALFISKDAWSTTEQASSIACKVLLAELCQPRKLQDVGISHLLGCLGPEPGSTSFGAYQWSC